MRALAEAHARIVLIGGLAAVLQGVPVVTNDIDFCYDPAEDNRAILVATLAPLHPCLRVANLSPTEARALPFIWDARTLRDSPNLTLQTDAGDLDLLASVAGVGGYADVAAASHTITVEEGLDVAVLDLPGLLAAKRAAGRPKDLMALPQIEATLLMRGDTEK